MRFRYFIVQHPSDVAVHEGYTDVEGVPIAVNGEPLTLWGDSPDELRDMVSMLYKDVNDQILINGDCESLYAAYDNIDMGNFSSYDLPPSDNVIEFKRKR